MKKPLEELILNNPMSYSQLASYYRTSRTSIRKKIKDMRREGYDIREKRKDNKKYFYMTKIVPKNRMVSDVYTDYFALVGDTHLGSRYAELEALESFYDEVQDRGIHDVFHAGDLCDGTNVYPGHLNDLEVWGLDDQLEYAVKKYPHRKDVTTHFIIGNHEGKYYKREKIDFGKLLAHRRPDLHYLGMDFKKVRLDENIELEISHPAGGAPYTLGYAAQKYLRNMPPSSRPDILQFGHLHRAFYANYQEVDIFYTGCFMGSTDWLRKKGIESTIGGWIVEMETENGRGIKSLKNEFIHY